MAKKDIWRNNVLIQGRYELSLGETRCMWFVLVHNYIGKVKVPKGTKGAERIVKKDKEGKEVETYYLHKGIEKDVEYIIDLDKYAELWEIRRDQAYKEVNEALKSLEHRSITLKASDIRPDLKKGTAIIPWVSAVTLSDSGKPSIEWNKYMVGYLNDLQRFTKIRIESLVNLRKFSYIRFYEVMKQYEKVGKRYFTVEELRELLENNSSYDEFGFFKRRKLDPAVKAVNMFTEINVSYGKENYVKEGRKVIGIWFFIDREERKVEKEKEREIREILKKEGRSD